MDDENQKDQGQNIPDEAAREEDINKDDASPESGDEAEEEVSSPDEGTEDESSASDAGKGEEAVPEEPVTGAAGSESSEPETALEYSQTAFDKEDTGPIYLPPNFGEEEPAEQMAQPPAGRGTAALVCGILSIIFAFIFNVAGIVLGVIAIVLATTIIHQTMFPTGRERGARICGIVGTVLSGLSLIMGIILSVMLFSAYTSLFDTEEDDYATDAVENVEDADDETETTDNINLTVITDDEAAEDDEITSATSVEEQELTDDEQKLVDLAKIQLDKIKDGDESTLQTIADIANSGFTTTFGYTMEECGIDPLDYARAMINGFEYTIINVDIGDDDTAIVESVVRTRDIFNIIDTLNELISEYNENVTAGNLNGDQDVAADIGSLFEEALNTDTTLISDSCYLYYTLQDGAWIINEDRWEDELNYFYGLV